MNRKFFAWLVGTSRCNCQIEFISLERQNTTFFQVLYVHCCSLCVCSGTRLWYEYIVAVQSTIQHKMNHSLVGDARWILLLYRCTIYTCFSHQSIGTKFRRECNQLLCIDQCFACTILCCSIYQSFFIRFLDYLSVFRGKPATCQRHRKIIYDIIHSFESIHSRVILIASKVVVIVPNNTDAKSAVCCWIWCTKEGLTTLCGTVLEQTHHSVSNRDGCWTIQNFSFGCKHTCSSSSSWCNVEGPEE
mmetsp:Transcript_7591/g.22212  ORF Transcript_7591/g.22212 Transcript_7591/m.22212 type:complete len:246 (+) Transcript_7591:4402-5139(+)